MGLNGDGNSMGHQANWGNRKEDKYQNAYAMAYGGSECYTQIHNPTHRMKPFGMSETWDEYGQSYSNYKTQNRPAMSKTQLHGPGKREPRVYGYGSPIPNPRFQNGNGMGHGFANHGNYEMTEAYGYEETNGYVEYENHGMTNGYMEYSNNGMARSQPHLRGKHSGHGNKFFNNQAYGPAKTMGFEHVEAETCEYFSNRSQYHDGNRAGNNHKAKGLISNHSGNNSCSDSDSDDDDDKGWNSKAL
ncbi:hypothetical protein V6N13_029903 [Hibiscus sabdariffa]|uniref:Uncharacterized protein n=2 Tax=Hibiscus sabdariffa TaxID=183260 RepID=A0ABR2T9A8_9ROSI